MVCAKSYAQCFLHIFGSYSPEMCILFLPEFYR